MSEGIRCKEFVPRCTCGKPINFYKVQIGEDRSIYMVGYCRACRQHLSCPLTLEDRKKVFAELLPREEPTITEGDEYILRALGVKLDDEP